MKESRQRSPRQQRARACAASGCSRGCRALVIHGVLALAACSKPASENGAPASSASSPPTVTAPTPRPSGGQPLAAPPPVPMGSNAPSTDPMATLFGQLDTELKHRPPVHPNVDDGFAALAKAGVPITTPQQSLGTTYRAAFCRHGVTAARDMSVAFCEYPDAAATAVGLTEAKKLFPGLASRHVYAHKTMLLITIFQQGDITPAVTAAQNRVVATFNTL